MDWFSAVNSYCERTDASYWSEPLNALSNAGFLVAAALCWRITARDPGARLLVGDPRGDRRRLVPVPYPRAGLGNDGRRAADPGLHPRLHLSRHRSLLRRAALGRARRRGGFVPASVAAGAAIGRAFGPLNGSVGYMPVVIVIAVYALALARRAPATARGMAAGAALLTASLFFRTIDAGICAAWPAGTHFLWHILNGILLGWMIRLLNDHGQAKSFYFARSAEGGSLSRSRKRFDLLDVLRAPERVVEHEGLDLAMKHPSSSARRARAGPDAGGRHGRSGRARTTPASARRRAAHRAAPAAHAPN